MSEDRIVTLSAATFVQAVLQGDGPIAVEFMAYSCAYCGVIEPVLQQAAARLASQETIYRVNTEVDPDLAERFEIQGTPTFIMFLNGSQVGRVEGPSPDLANVLDQLTQPFQ
jgi:thioredoxin-like negative regulator of GroEL